MSNYHRSSHRSNEQYPDVRKYARLYDEDSPKYSKMGQDLLKNRLSKPTDKLAYNDSGKSLVESEHYANYARSRAEKWPEYTLAANRKKSGPRNRIQRIKNEVRKK